MAEVALTGIRKSFADTRVLEDLSLHIPDGEFCVILGPSGCGKSTLLRLIAGLEQADRGEIHIAGREVTDVPPGKRDVGMVFQNYALYPHMTVAQNLGFPLRIRREADDRIADRVREVASMLDLSGLLERRPRELSGGQRQRVALGRAIAQRPLVYLLDEPLSNVDALLRVRMRTELARLWRALGATMVFVTHDQSEALALGSIICVMHDGRIQQIGTPAEIYDRPQNQFVAEFVGTPSINIVDGSLRYDRNLYLDPWQLPLPLDTSTQLRAWQGRKIRMGVRPEDLEATRDPGAELSLKAEIESAEYLGSVTWLTCRVAGHRLIARAADDAPRRQGAPCQIRMRRERFHWFDPETGLRIWGP